MPKNNQKTKKPAKKAVAQKPLVSAKPKNEPAKKSVKVKAPAEKPKLSKAAFKKTIINALLEQKSKILKDVSHKVKNESNVLKFEIGDIYDIASNERERELGLMLGDRDREKLAEIEDAFVRLKDNIYGECEECGEPIADERLLLLPATRVCVECQSRNEKELKIKGKLDEDMGLGIIEKTESEEEEI